MKGSDIFPSKYVKASDLNGRDVLVTIDRATLEKLGDDQKLILYFQGKEKGMVVNKTNFGRVSYLYGDETDDWAGKQIVLTAEFVEFQGKTVKGLRIRPPKTPTQVMSKGQMTGPLMGKHLGQSENPADPDDEIPF